MTPATVVTAWERRSAGPALVFDLIDRFARDRGTAGPGPRPIGPIRYRIVATEDNNVRTVLVDPLRMVIRRNAAGYDLWFGAVTRGDGPVSRYEPAPPPAIVVEVSAERFQRAEAIVGVLPRPVPPLQLALEPGPGYEFPDATAVPGSTGPTLLRGTLRGADGTRIAGARVRVDPPLPDQPDPAPECVSDTTGNWVLPFDDAVATTTARLEISSDGNPPTLVPEVAIIRGDSSTLRAASLAGSVRRATGSAFAGAAITADLAPGLSTSSDADGRWELWLPVDQFPPSGGPRPVVVTAQAAGLAPIVRFGDIRPRSTAPIATFVFP